MTREEAIAYLEDSIGKREQHDEAIRMATEALQNSPTQMSGTSDNSKQQRVFKKLAKDKKGYYSIIWEEDGEENEGYSSFSLDVISDFLKEYFIQEPKQADSGSSSCINHENTHVITTDDLISRQAAIDVIEDVETKRLKGEIEMIYAHAINGLRALPSAQPERKPGASDLISRCELFNRLANVKDLGEAFAVIQGMPTAQPLTGKWIPDNNNYYDERYICSQCGVSYKVDTCMGKPSWDFCPACGTKMEVSTVSEMEDER